MVNVYHGSSQVWRRVEGRAPLRCDFDQQAVDYACRDGEMGLWIWVDHDYVKM